MYCGCSGPWPRARRRSPESQSPPHRETCCCGGRLRRIVDLAQARRRARSRRGAPPAPSRESPGRRRGPAVPPCAHRPYGVPPSGSARTRRTDGRQAIAPGPVARARSGGVGDRGPRRPRRGHHSRKRWRGGAWPGETSGRVRRRSRFLARRFHTRPGCARAPWITVELSQPTVFRSGCRRRRDGGRSDRGGAGQPYGSDAPPPGARMSRHQPPVHRGEL